MKPVIHYVSATFVALLVFATSTYGSPTEPPDTFCDCSDCPEMVLIPEGSFEMGGKYSVEQPRHQVNVSRFALGKTEVTQGEWKAIMGSNPSRFRDCGDTCPVDSVSWEDIQHFIARLNTKTGKHYRLPSEAEWEYACKAGQQHEYCGSNNFDIVGWYGAHAIPAGNSAVTTNPVAQRQPNAFGLYDMSGNVWEWTEDCWHDNYHEAPSNGIAWTKEGNCNYRVLRGSSWLESARFAYAAYREANKASSRHFNNGFRLAYTPIKK